MKIRWTQYKRQVSAEMVKAYSREHTISMKQAKEVLEKDNTGMILQYRTWYGVWKDIPTVIHYFK